MQHSLQTVSSVNYIELYQLNVRVSVHNVTLLPTADTLLFKEDLEGTTCQS